MRALLIVLDRASCGSLHPEAALGKGQANSFSRLFSAGLALDFPVLHSLGLWKTVTGDVFHPLAQGTRAGWGRAQELSPARGSTTAHWEIAGVLLQEPFPLFTEFPSEWLAQVEQEARVRFLGNRLGDGSRMIEHFGPEHLKSGRPILYTSVDSVLQIAAHEEVLPLARLYEICRIARRWADKLRVGRVIARPFTGALGSFERTDGRREWAMLPPRTILNALAEEGWMVDGIGKIGDIFAGSGLTRSHATSGDDAAYLQVAELWHEDEDGLIFVNLADFEAPYSERKQVSAYVETLRKFEHFLSVLVPHVESDDLVIVTADPGWQGSGEEHDARRTWEAPLFALHQGYAGPLGTRRTFADVAATLADFFHLRQRWPVGQSMLPAMLRR